jgi:hypothetical protein
MASTSRTRCYRVAAMLSRPFPGAAASGNVAIMTDVVKVPELVRLLAEQQGLHKALALFPEQVVAAAERGLRPLGDTAAGTPSTMSPAPVFDPAQFESGE